MKSLFQTRLRELRGVKNQAEFAKLLDLKPAAYGHYETGRTEPSIGMIIRIVEITGVSADYLLGIVDDPRSSGKGNPQAERTAQAKLVCVKKAFFKLNEAFKELEGAL